MHKLFPVTSSAAASNDNHVSVTRRPLALHTKETAREIEDEVIPSAFGHRAVNVDIEFERRACNGELGNRSFCPS
jgi:hypothetical protein